MAVGLSKREKIGGGCLHHGAPSMDYGRGTATKTEDVRRMAALHAGVGLMAIKAGLDRAKGRPSA